MAAIVKSIEKFSLTLGAGTASASGTLTKGQTTANCLPVIGTRVTTIDTNHLQAYATDAYFSGSTVVVETGRETTRALVVEVTVIEFDTTVSNTRVDQYVFDFTDTEASSVVTVSLSPTPDTTKAFPYITWQMGGDAQAWGPNLCFAEFKPGDASIMEMDRGIHGSVTMAGHLYIVQSDEFTVQSKQLYIPDASNTVALSPSVTLAETFLMGSYKSDYIESYNMAGSVEASFTSSLLTVQADNAAGYRQGTWYAVSMDSSVGNVQHGSLTQSTSVASQSIDITAVDEDASLVMATGLPGNMGGGSFPRTSDERGDVFCAWDFVDTDTIRVQHGTVGGDADNDLTWQVIEWETTGTPPATGRRVMVIS